MAVVKRQSAYTLMKENLRIYEKAEEINRKMQAAPLGQKGALLETHQRLYEESLRNKERIMGILERKLRHLPPEARQMVARVTYTRVMNGDSFQSALKFALLRHAK